MVQHQRINQATQPTLTADPGSATPPQKALPSATLKMDLTNLLKRTAEAEDESKRPELKKLKLEMTYTTPGSDPTAANPKPRQLLQSRGVEITQFGAVSS
jgi:hypothetical protein